MLGIFKKKSVEFVAPVTGRVIDLSKVDDQVFSQKMLGDGIAIIPEEGEVVSPFDGKVVQVFNTLHAVVLEKNGINFLIHIGLETVGLNGEGFTAYVKDGQKVKQGDKLIDVDLDFIQSKGCKIDIPMVIVEGEYESLEVKIKDERVEKGKDLILEVK